MPQGGENLQGLSEETEGLINEAESVEDIGDEDEGTDSGPETARETVAKQLNLLKEEDSGDKGAESAPAPQKGRGVVKRTGKAAPPQAEFNIPPPNRLNAAQKEVFNKLPADLRRATHEMFKNHEGLLTRAVQRARTAEKESAHIVETVRPYLLAHPELQAEGYTEAKLISGLIAAHQRLTNPETAKQAWAELGQQIGIPVDALNQLLGGAGASSTAQMDISRHPQFVALQKRLNKITSKIEGDENQKFSASVQSVVSEMEAIREEKDQFGRYLYPKLHDGDFLEQAKPLVSALVKAVPNLGYGEALKRAYYTLEGQNGTFPQVGQARLPQTKMERPSAAAVSVRGRSAPTLSGEMEEIPLEALKDAKTTTAWALKQLRSGRG